MLQFIIYLKNKRKGELQEDLLKAHIQHLKDLKQKGTLVICGPLGDNDGAIQIVKANSLEEAREYAKSDPFIANNYYQDYQVIEFIEANKSNNYLYSDPQTNINKQVGKG